MASISLPSPQTTFLQTLLKHQFLPSVKPSLKSTSLLGRTAIITGGSTGIGLACAKLLLSLQLPHLIIATRSSEKGEKAASELGELYPKANVEFWRLDLNSYESVRQFACRCATLSSLDIAILNAGIMKNDFIANVSTGHEETFQVNYLSAALLAILLIPVLTASLSNGPGRLTIVSSVAAVTTAFPEKDFVPIIPGFDREDNWSSSVAKQRYDVTKLLLLMFMFKLSSLVKAEDVIINAVDPGFTLGTELFRNISLAIKVPMWPLAKLIAISPEKGAWTYVDACIHKGAESHGSFLSDWQIHAFHPIMYTPEGDSLMNRLWGETIRELECDEKYIISDSK
ncbi:unnamed protein product [Clonostachys rosea]|uniref:Ketoreductase (KR) domain-containing protein n=1 Tax=Bionectria ochroleuca TaxID=29856 RepID=A0ABY6UU43_BIOOC|nr:unnamed protein product [Clonostachys rosea]